MCYTRSSYGSFFRCFGIMSGWNKKSELRFYFNLMQILLCAAFLGCELRFKKVDQCLHLNYPN